MKKSYTASIQQSATGIFFDDGQDPIVEVLADGDIEVVEIMKEINANLNEA